MSLLAWKTLLTDVIHHDNSTSDNLVKIVDSNNNTLRNQEEFLFLLSPDLIID